MKHEMKRKTSSLPVLLGLQPVARQSALVHSICRFSPHPTDIISGLPYARIIREGLSGTSHGREMEERTFEILVTLLHRNHLKQRIRQPVESVNFTSHSGVTSVGIEMKKNLTHSSSFVWFHSCL